MRRRWGSGSKVQGALDTVIRAYPEGSSGCTVRVGKKVSMA